jgi:hypothetical protein
MNTKTMTVHEALSELKVLSDRIQSKVTKSKFIDGNKHANTKIDGKSISDYTDEMKQSLQSVQDLINYRNAIKRAVTKSNANTNVTITKDSGETVTMTVAELIEYKSVGIKYIEYFLSAITKQHNDVIRTATSMNRNIEENADTYVTKLFGSKDSVDADAVKKTRESYIEANTIDILDPNNIKGVMEQLQNEIDFYNSKVDSALSTSNALTTITVEW